VVYADSGTLPHLETALKLPVSPYGVSKLASEYYLACYHALYGLGVVSLRYSNVYGPRQNPHGEAGVVAIFGNRLQSGKPLTIYGDGSQTRDYVFVKDVARANLLASTGELPKLESLDSVAFNVGTGVETSVNALAQAMLDAAEREVPIQHQEARPGELLRSSVSASKAENRWGWQPGVALLEGLRQTYDWIVHQA
jgi:UDP-glucose 4-epimerase